MSLTPRMVRGASMSPENVEEDLVKGANVHHRWGDAERQKLQERGREKNYT
jgi:hypothetical protein